MSIIKSGDGFISESQVLISCLWCWTTSIFELWRLNIIIVSLLTNTNLRLANCVLATRKSTSQNSMYTLSLLLFLRKPSISMSECDLYCCDRCPMVAPVDQSNLIWLDGILKEQPDGSHQSRSVHCRLWFTSCSQKASMMSEGWCCSAELEEIESVFLLKSTRGWWSRWYIKWTRQVVLEICQWTVTDQMCCLLNVNRMFCHVSKAITVLWKDVSLLSTYPVQMFLSWCLLTSTSSFFIQHDFQQQQQGWGRNWNDGKNKSWVMPGHK